jgi:hypothetical protein
MSHMLDTSRQVLAAMDRRDPRSRRLGSGREPLQECAKRSSCLKQFHKSTAVFEEVVADGAGPEDADEESAGGCSFTVGEF